MTQTILHYGLHLLAPWCIAWIWFGHDWLKVSLILLTTMLVDLDHLLATPILDADRCSIGYHYLHTSWAILIYVLLLFMPRLFRIIGIGLLFHMLTDLIDCLFIYSECPTCYDEGPRILRWLAQVLIW